jgi:hypothetical protein
MIKLKTKILKTLSNSVKECSYGGDKGRLESPLKINRTGLNAGIYKVLYRLKEKLWSLQNN